MTIDTIEGKLKSMNTDLNQLSYLEITLKEPGLSFEIKRFLLGKTANLYEQRKMYEKGARALSNKGTMEITLKERIETYLKSAELYAKCGKVEDAESIFIRASREAGEIDRKKIKLARKNIYTQFAGELEKVGKKATALKFYEKLLKTRLDPLELKLIKEKAIETYRSLGMFHEAKLLENI